MTSTVKSSISVRSHEYGPEDAKESYPAIEVAHGEYSELGVEEDDAKVLALGYKKEFKREFSMLSVFAFSFSLLGLLPSLAATFYNQQLLVGASPVPWIIAIVLVSCVALSLAEIASAFPVSAGAPYAVSRLSPPKYKALLTWSTCWANWFSQITGPASINSSEAAMILALATFNDPSFKITHGKVYGVSTALMVIQAIISSFPTKWLARVNSFTALANVVFLIIVFVVFFAANNRVKMYNNVPKFNDNSKAWGLENLTNYPQGVATLMSFLGVIWSMSGYDASFHLAEECANAAKAVPISIILTSTVGGFIGFMFMIAMAYTIVDIREVANDPLGLGQPFVTYMTQFLSKDLVNMCTSLTIVSSFFMGCSCMLGASRVTFAYSRDHLLPFAQYWKKVHPITRTPINAVWLNFIIGQLLLLMMFAGPAAMSAIFSVGAIAGFMSFTMPTLLKITYARSTFQPGPIYFGKFSMPLGVISVAFITLMVPILCMPTVRGAELNPVTMNWTCLVFFGPLSIVIAWFLLSAHKWYQGPRSNIDVGWIPSEEKCS